MSHLALLKCKWDFFCVFSITVFLLIFTLFSEFFEFSLFFWQSLVNFLEWLLDLTILAKSSKQQWVCFCHLCCPIFFLTFLCVLLSIFKKFGINNDFVICRCTCWPRQPSQLSGCHWGRHGSVYRILGQLPQDLELKLKQQDPTLKIHLTKLLSSWQQQNHNQSFWKLLKIKRLNDNEQKKWFRSNFFQVLFLALLGFRFPMFKISDDEC